MFIVSVRCDLIQRDPHKENTMPPYVLLKRTELPSFGKFHHLTPASAARRTPRT